ncbi:MAG TPA: YdcF family protein [Ferrovibrio sp.]|uniref:YdcF family protein n=1 Tax=Ferrovibrio sp. TaxID=1917215 RepID=UPI002ED522FF
MVVYAGKILWWLLSPANLILGLLLFAAALGCWGRTRVIGARLGGVLLVLLVLIGLLPVGDWVQRPLEDYFPVPSLPAEVDGIIVLGGSEEPRLSEQRHAPQLNDSAERLIQFVALARQYPGARLLYTGGGIQWPPTSIGEADVARRVFVQLGLVSTRIAFDNQSRNTADSAISGKALMRPKPGETWILVTSAAHMPRAVNCFQAVGWPVLPYPVDYMTGPARRLRFSPFGHLFELDRGAREWVGLIAYRLLGHTKTILPPRTKPASEASNIGAEAWPQRSQ